VPIVDVRVKAREVNVLGRKRERGNLEKLCTVCVRVREKFSATRCKLHCADCFPGATCKKRPRREPALTVRDGPGICHAADWRREEICDANTFNELVFSRFSLA
jgi:hypothetical protein